MKEPCQAYIWTKFHVEILQNDRVSVLWRSKRAIFHTVSAISKFSLFSLFSDFGPFRSLISVWPFLELMTLNDLDLEYAHRKLRMILRSVPDTIHVVVLTYFHFIRLWCATKPDTPNRQTFWLCLTCDVISEPEVNNIRFPSTNFRGISNAVWIL